MKILYLSYITMLTGFIATNNLQKATHNLLFFEYSQLLRREIITSTPP